MNIRVDRRQKISFATILALAVLAVSGISCGGGKQEAVSGADLKSLTASKAGTPNYLDSINGISDLTHGTAHIPRLSELNVTGWAVDVAAKQPASKVYIELDGKYYLAQYGLARPDVSTVLTEPKYAYSGFMASIPGPFGDGEHHATVQIVNAAGTAYYTGMSVAFLLQ
jgi:hypothetical protein